MGRYIYDASNMIQSKEVSMPQEVVVRYEEDYGMAPTQNRINILSKLRRK
jgi:hypothetical protein